MKILLQITYLRMDQMNSRIYILYLPCFFFFKARLQTVDDALRKNSIFFSHNMRHIFPLSRK